MTEAELRAAFCQGGPRERRRYALAQFDEVRNWETYRPGGDGWFGFRAVRELRGLPPEILMVSMPGHTEGQAAVAVKKGDGWLLHAADVYFDRHEMDHPERKCPPGKFLYQRMMAYDYDLHLHNQARLRELYHRRSGLAVFCTHDAVEFEALRQLQHQARSAPFVTSRANQAERAAHAI